MLTEAWPCVSAVFTWGVAKGCSVWRTTLLACLLVVASDALLRQREAASDLARSLAEVGPGGQANVVEPVDEEPLDQPGQALVKAFAGVAYTDALAVADASPSLAGFSLTTPTRSPSRVRPGLTARPPERPSQRLSLLQCFLF
jgi:hypothetical protein